MWAWNIRYSIEISDFIKVVSTCENTGVKTFETLKIVIDHWFKVITLNTTTILFGKYCLINLDSDFCEHILSD